jgi:WD40 repeat protein
MKRHSKNKNYNIKNKRKSKINGGRPPVLDNGQCRVITILSGHRNFVTSVAFHPTSHLLATGCLDNTAKLWRFSADASIHTCVETMEKEDDRNPRVMPVAFHATLPLLATRSGKNNVKLWRCSADGSLVTNVANLGGEHGHIRGVTTVAFHPRLPLLATGAWDNTVKLWRFNPHGLESGNMSATCEATIRGDGDVTKSVVFHPELPLLAFSSSDQTAKLFRFDPDGSEATNMSATCVATLGGAHEHSYRITSVAFHPKLPLLAIGSTDNTAKLWRFNPLGSEATNMSATCVAILEGKHGHTQVVTSVVFHPALPLLATGSWDSTAKLWGFNPHGLESGNMSATCVYTLRGHDNWVSSVAFHPKLPLLATGSVDRTARLWRCKMLIIPYNNFTLYRMKGDVSEDICNSLCYLCNFKLCKKNSSDNNNSNGYVVKLTKGDLTKDIHVHYNCLHFQLITNKTEIDNIPISSDTIQTILNIDDKMNALIGTDFYK